MRADSRLFRALCQRAEMVSGSMSTQGISCVRERESARARDIYIYGRFGGRRDAGITTVIFFFLERRRER